MKLHRWLLHATMVLLVPAAVSAEVKVPGIFGDHMVLQRDKPLPVWGSAAPGEEVVVTFDRKSANGAQSESKSTAADKDGKWEVKLGAVPAAVEGGTLTIKGAGNSLTFTDVLVGEVWICSGQSNMEWQVQSSADAARHIADANHPEIRLFKVPRRAAPQPENTVSSQWKTCAPETVKDFSAVGYFFGRDLQQQLKVPIGLIDTSYGGTPAEAWTSRDGLLHVDSLKYYIENLDNAIKSYDADKAKKGYEELLAKWESATAQAKKDNKLLPKKPTPPQKPGYGSHSPAGLYNAMVAPLIPYAIRGAIWYQGESNSGRAYEYRTLLPAMIEDWRKRWGEGDFPFLIVQLAPYWDGNSSGVRYAELRDAQLHTVNTVKNTAMAVITDYGDEKDIHPKQKEPVGMRLALAARALAYGEKTAYSGPTFRFKKIDGNRIILSFEHTDGGLMSKGDKLLGFEIAGENNQFVNADAQIEGDTVVVSSPAVKEPVNVRFGWKNYTPLNLFNKEGLPASPFRTDDLPYTTMPKK